MALLWRTLLTAAGSTVALQRLPCRVCSRPLMTHSGSVMEADERAARSARLREKLAQVKANRAVDKPKPALEELRLDSLTPADWTRIIEEVGPFMKDNRVAKLREVLDRRRAGIHVVLENIADPHNAAAVLRTSEGLGIQHVHVIESVCEFHLPTANALAAGKGSLGSVAMGASRWLSVSRYRKSVDCYQHLRALGLQIFSSDCPPLSEEGDEPLPAEQGSAWLTHKQGRTFEAQSIETLDWAAAPGTALVFGNERRGVSRAFIEASDASFFLPMCGFTQSFNISVAAAMALWSAVASGAFPEGTLTPEEKAELLGLWLLRDVKAAKPILRHAGIDLVDF